jgi:NTE family protein
MSLDTISPAKTPAASPVDFVPGDESRQPEDGTALCLSGGGYRAMLFHTGALWRLNEMGLLMKIARYSSVSGGSITSATLALNWTKLGFDAEDRAQQFQGQLVQPIRNLASRTIDMSSVLGGIIGGGVAHKVAEAYKKYLFGDATLQDLPDTPRFVFNATNVQSKALWRFSKPYMRDWRVGEVRNPKIPLATAVGASSACPPFLSPVELDLQDSDFVPGSGAELQKPPYTTQVILTDGGVYDNLGLETAWKRYTTVLVSDGGGMAAFEPDPKRDWAQHTYRVMNLLDDQVRSLRKRQIISGFKQGDRKGAYWSTWTDIREYALQDALPCDLARTRELAATPTRLKAIDARLQERIINWGYAACDAGIRKYGGVMNAPSPQFPYSGGIEYM